MRFGGGPLGGGVFLAKYDPNGVHLWSKRFDGAADAADAADAANNVLLTGRFTGSVDFGGGRLASAGRDDAFLVKLDPSGAHVWSHSFGDTGRQIGRAVAADADGNVVLTGAIDGAVDFGGGPTAPAGEFDTFLAVFDPGGAYLRGQRFGDSGGQQSRSLAVDGSGNAVMTGEYDGGVDFGGGPFASAGSSDIFLVEFGVPILGVPSNHSRPDLWLGPARPNPTRTESAIPFALSHGGAVSLRVFDLEGRLVRRIVSGWSSAGPHQARWDGLDERGRSVRSGLYVYRLESGTDSRVGRLMITR